MSNHFIIDAIKSNQQIIIQSSGTTLDHDDINGFRVSGSRTSLLIHNSGNSSSVPTTGIVIGNLARTFFHSFSNDLHYTRGFISENRVIINSGISNSGNIVAGQFIAQRNFNNSGDYGHLSSIYGSVIQYGHNRTNPSASPVTDSAFGLYVQPYNGPGTINNIYDIYVTDNIYTSETGTLSNAYGLYINGEQKTNYIAGHLSIGTGLSTGSKVYINTNNNQEYNNILASGGAGSENSLVRISNSSNVATNSFAGLFLSTNRQSSNVAQGAVIASVSTNMSTFTPNIVFASRTASTAYTEYMRINHSGNVGIGTNSPLYRLHVDGVAYVSSGLLINGTGISLNNHTHTINLGSENTAQLSFGTNEVLNIVGSGGISISFNDATNTLTIVPPAAVTGYEELSTAKDTFAVSPNYRVGTLSVYYNGLRLINGRDFNATNGTSFTLTESGVVGHVVEWVGTT